MNNKQKKISLIFFNFQMESFTIKYDIDDLIPKKQTNKTGNGENDVDDGESGIDALNNNNKSNHKNLVNNCICLRMARMFTDLLSKPDQHDAQNSTDPQPNELKHIHKEIKTLRKYQFELNEKLNYIFAKLSNSSTHHAFKAPSSNPIAKKQSKPANTISPNSIHKATSSSTSGLLTGAKKRKFNSSKTSAYPNENAANFRSNTSTPTSSNSSSVSSLVSDPPKQIDYDDEEEENEEDEDENNELEVNSVSSNHNDECLNEIKEENRPIDLEMEGNEEEDDEENSNSDTNAIGKEHSLTDLVESYASFRNAPSKAGFSRSAGLKQPEQHMIRPNMRFNGNNSLPAQKYSYPNQNRLNYNQNRGFSSNSSNSNGSCNANQRVMSQKVDYKPLAQVQAQSQQQQQQPVFDIDIDELFKGDGPKYLQLESYKNFKPPIALVGDKYYIDEHMAAIAYSKSKSRRNFAAHLTKLVFTPRERLESNCNGRFGKKALDSTRLSAIRNTLFKYYPCKQSTVILNGDKITSGDHDENNVWIRDCIPAIDESNRVLKKQLISWYKKNHNIKTIKGGNSYNGVGGGGGEMGNASTSGNASYNESLMGSQAYYGLNGGGYGLDEQDFDEDFEDNE